MRIHYLQHVPFEDLANMESWAFSRGHTLSKTRLFSGERLPNPSSFDWLIIMGGPMNIYEEEIYAWLAEEKEFIKRAVYEGKIVLGVCLGAQLISSAMGGIVTKNRYQEIGWFPVRLTEEGRASPVFSALPERFPALHWHGDTFSIPQGASRMAESDACPNQAFILGKAIGLQFHLESNAQSMKRFLDHCVGEMTAGPYVQMPEDLAAAQDGYDGLRALMESLLDRIERELGP